MKQRAQFPKKRSYLKYFLYFWEKTRWKHIKANLQQCSIAANKRLWIKNIWTRKFVQSFAICLTVSKTPIVRITNGTHCIHLPLSYINFTFKRSQQLLRWTSTGMSTSIYLKRLILIRIMSDILIFKSNFKH